jgi:alkaline phosphatase D
MVQKKYSFLLGFPVFVLLIIFFLSALDGSAQKMFFTTGFKVTELTEKSVIIWTRLCSQAKPNPIVHARKESVFRHPLDFDENMPIDKMDGGVKGAKGLVRITLMQDNHHIKSDWHLVSEKEDYTAKVAFNNLKSDKCYEILLEAKASDTGTVSTAKGSFCTAPSKNSILPVSLTSSTCQYFWSFDDEQRGFKTYDNMNKLNPDFFIQTGDYVYYDKPGPLATTIAKARHKWHAMDSRPSLVDFYKKTPAYLLKDDHDILSDDAAPSSPPYGDLKFNDGLAIWHENVPLRDKPYRTFRWGKDLQIWLIEGREFRSDTTRNEEGDKTIWGAEQKKWFKKTISESNATFKLIFSPTPIVGPDREAKSDNHANKTFKQEGDWIRKLISDINNSFVVSGDRHWQYVSKDTGTGLIEFGSGPVSDYHAQGWDPKDKRPQHKFLRVKGGFIGIKVDRQNGKPFIKFTHNDVDGNKVNEEKFFAK